VRQQALKETQRLQKERQTLVKRFQTDHERFESLAATTDHAQRIAGSAELHERQEKSKRGLDEIESEVAALQSNEIDDAEITAALTNFNEVWDKLSPKEQSRFVALLIERVEYDGREGNVSITFHPTGIHALRDELATQEQVA
jgi:site-specific DNA recombinase